MLATVRRQGFLSFPHPNAKRLRVPLQAVNTLTGAELLDWRRRLLDEGGDAASLDWLLDLAGGVDGPARVRLRLEPQRPVALRCRLDQLAGLWRQHLRQHTPLQYLVKLCPWRDLELQVGPGVLIPRPETEQLVDLALELIAPEASEAPGPNPAQPSCRPLRWADLGTGSGCLAVALARAFPAGRGVAVDCSSEALSQARANLQAGGVSDRVTLHQGSWWSPLGGCPAGLDLVLSNPPYIPTSLIDTLEPVVRLHEPRLALDGGDDGLKSLRLIAAGADDHLAPGGWLVLEHHHDQGESVQALLRAGGLEQVASFLDLEGQTRFSGGRRPAHPPADNPAHRPAGRPAPVQPLVDGRSGAAGGIAPWG